MAAFLGRAVTALLDCPELIEDQEIRRKLATLVNITLAPDDSNPWDLPTSTSESDWGTKPESVRRLFDRIPALLGDHARLVLDIVNINEIAFEQYEDVVLDLTRAGSIIAIGFDYAELVRLANGPSVAMPEGRAAHLVRLTPLGAETEALPSVLSSDFSFDYSGEVAVFDDSLEMCDRGLLVRWRHLVRACLAIDGAFWGVRHA